MASRASSSAAVRPRWTCSSGRSRSDSALARGSQASPERPMTSDSPSPRSAEGERYDFRHDSNPDLIDLAKVDAEPDVGLVVDYADGLLSAEDAASVERRLETDEEFRE